jgi:Protein of unknown function (DUF4246)
MSEKMVDYCIAELRYNAKIYENTGLVSVFYGDVIKSDTAIPAWLQSELKASVAPLENIPARYLDWHPGSISSIHLCTHLCMVRRGFSPHQKSQASKTVSADAVKASSCQYLRRRTGVYLIAKSDYSAENSNGFLAMLISLVMMGSGKSILGSIPFPLLHSRDIRNLGLRAISITFIPLRTVLSMPPLKK